MIKRPLFLTAAALIAIASPDAAKAQFGDALSSTALAVRAYEASAERCAYAPIVGRALARLSEHYAETEPYRWRRVQRESRDTAEIVQNFGRLLSQGPRTTLDPNAARRPPPPPEETDCRSFGLSVGSALIYAAPLIGFDPVLMSESDRLIGGKGRARTEGEADLE